MKERKLGKKVFLFSHPDLLTWYGNALVSKLNEEGFEVFIQPVAPGEKSKNFGEVERSLSFLLENKVERNHTVVALGGGVIGDLAGFVASIALRGINLIQIPTTLLAQVDSAIGGKTGVNHTVGKNLIGTFYQPKLTVCDVDVLKTLPPRELRCGLAEIIKYGVIWDPELFRFIEENLDVLKKCSPQTDRDIWKYLILRSAQIKAEVVSKDEKESDLRAILNFGHTIGHAIEALAGYADIQHGEAVAIGMTCAGKIALKSSDFSENDYIRLENLINSLEYPKLPKNLDKEMIVEKLFSDKKVKEGELRFILPTKIGNVINKGGIPLDLIRESLH